jgi:hypothetical protein
MRLIPWALLLSLLFPAFLHAQCGKDNRSNKTAGILISDFTISGTRPSGQPRLPASPEVSSVRASMKTRTRWRSGFELHFRVGDTLR